MERKVKFEFRSLAISWRLIGWSLVGALLLLPFIAMQFTTEVHWQLNDFVIAAFLLGGAGLAIELAVRKSRNNAYKIAVGLAVTASVLMIWMNGAVGIIGNEGNPANLMYFGILLCALLGALFTRFKAKGMAITMYITSAIQILVFLIAWLVFDAFTGPITVFFLAFWLSAAILFQKAATPGS